MKEKAFLQLGMGPINMLNNTQKTNNYYIITIFLGCCNNCSSTTVLYVILLLHSSNPLRHAFPTCQGYQIFWPFDPARA